MVKIKVIGVLQTIFVNAIDGVDSLLVFFFFFFLNCAGPQCLSIIAQNLKGKTSVGGLFKIQIKTHL